MQIKVGCLVSLWHSSLLHHRRRPRQEAFKAIGGTDLGIKLRVSDLMPLVFDVTGTPLNDTAAWLKKMVPAAKWHRFEDEMGHSAANYLGNLLRTVPRKWTAARSASRTARYAAGRRSYRPARAH